MIPRKDNGWAIEDVADLRTYTASIVRERFAQLPESMKEEARQEAICLAFELHKKWDKERCESFKDFLSTYLYLRLIDWWRSTRVHDGGVKTEDGTYEAPTLSVADIDTFDSADEDERLGAYHPSATNAMPWIMAVSEERRPRIRWLVSLQAYGFSAEEARAHLEKSSVIANDPNCRGSYPRHTLEKDLRLVQKVAAEHFTVALGSDYLAAATLQVDRSHIVNLKNPDAPRIDPANPKIAARLQELENAA